MFNWPRRPELNQTLEVIQAQIWAYETKPLEGDLDDIVLSSRQSFQFTCDANRVLDGKAEWMLTLASAACGATLAYGDRLPLDQGWSVIPLCAFLLSMWLSMVGRSPLPICTPMSTRDAIEAKQKAPAEYQYWICAQLHCSVTAMETFNAFKADMINYAARALVCGMMLIVALTAISHL